MKFSLRYLLILTSIILFSACAPKSGGYTVSVVKPKKTLFFKGYRDKKGKKKKRVKTVKYKTINQRR